MRLEDTAIYEISSTKPTNPANLKVGDTVEVWISKVLADKKKAVGADLCILVRLTRLDPNGNFVGTVIEPSGFPPQHVTGSFVKPDPDLHIAWPRPGR